MAGLMDKLQRMWNPPEDEYEYDEYPEEAETEPEESQDYAPAREESRGLRRYRLFHRSKAPAIPQGSIATSGTIPRPDSPMPRGT